MDGKGVLNLELAGNIAHLKYLLKEFELRRRSYKAFYRGKSFEFDGYRTYSEGDDASSIDWKASARASQLLEKQYRREEDMKILFVIDIGDTMVSGSSEKLKCEYAAEVVLSLSHLIIEDNNKVGYVLFNNGIEYSFSPTGGINNYYEFADKLSQAKIYGGKSNIAEALEFTGSNFDRSISAVILVSDFLHIDANFKMHLDIVSKRFETMAIMIKDPIDRELPDVSGEFVIEDSASGEQLLIDPKVAGKRYAQHAQAQEKAATDALVSSGVDTLLLMTDKPFILSLTNFIKNRRGRRGVFLS